MTDAKLQFVRRLGRNWRELSDALDIPLYDQRRFTPGDEVLDLWEWLDDRDRLKDLPEALRLVGRADLADLLTTPVTARTRPTLPGNFSGDDRAFVAVAVERLADSVNNQWTAEVSGRRIDHPFAMPVRWSNARPELSDHWANILRLPPGSPDPSVDLANELQHIADTFQYLPRRRLVILGRSGSGKTVLTIRLALDIIQSRGRGDPVPFVVGIASWDPGSKSLNDWLKVKLAEDHAYLAETLSTGATLAATLMDHGWITPILDGLDEMAVHLQSQALTVLSRQSTEMLVTSRTREYSVAVQGAHTLSGAAVVELHDLTLDDLESYLPRATPVIVDEAGRLSAKWDPVIAYLRLDLSAERAQMLLTVLCSPLMLGLARSVYSDHRLADPAELLDERRFPDAESIEEYLLDSYITAAYEVSKGRWGPEEAVYWHRRIAQILQRLQTRDIAWWQLGDAVAAPTRIGLGLLVGSTGGALLLAFVWQFGVGLGGGFGVGVGADRSPPPPTNAVDAARAVGHMDAVGRLQFPRRNGRRRARRGYPEWCGRHCH